MAFPIVDIHTHSAAARMDGRSIVSLSVGDPLQGTRGLEPGLFYSVGLHPWQVSGDWEQLVRLLLLPMLDSPQVVAVGEAGLDYRCPADRGMQSEAFVRQAVLAEKSGKPLIVHCVKAYDDLIRLHRRLAPSVPWILHGFRGKALQAAQLLREGFFLSLGEHYHAETLQVCPVDRLFIESDESTCELLTLYQQAARIKNMPVEELVRQVQDNIRKCFPFPSLSV